MKVDAVQISDSDADVLDARRALRASRRSVLWLPLVVASPFMAGAWLTWMAGSGLPAAHMWSLEAAFLFAAGVFGGSVGSAVIGDARSWSAAIERSEIGAN